MKKFEEKSIITSGNIKFKEIEARKNIYKKITKKDFVLAFTFSFLFVFWIYWVQNSQNYKADLFDEDLEEIIYDWEDSRTFSPTLSFYPENTVINNWTRQEWKNVYLDYYTLETPDDIIEISLDNITSTPTCSYWWKYKFQWTSQYLKLWEDINESDISIYWTNYPLLSNQDWINANYKVDSTWTWITIYFNKDIKNWKYYDFALEDWIKIYENYKTLEEFNSWEKTFSISWNELKISFENNFETNFWRIIISENLISDLDWRINSKWWVVWKKILNEIVIDNKKSLFESLWTWSLVLKLSFDENIYENTDKSFQDNIQIWWISLSSINNYSEYDIDWNSLNIYFSWSIKWDLNILEWAIVDKNWNEIEWINIWNISVTE